MRALPFALLLLCASSAFATPTVRTSLDGDDFLWMTLTGAGGGAVAGVGGALLGSILDADCTVTATSSCPPPAFTIAGAWSGLVIGSAFSVKWYGDGQGYRGRFTPTLVGGILGNMASGLPIVLVASSLEDDALRAPLLIALMVGGPALGATLGYQYSLPDGEAEAAASGGLVDLGRDGLSFGIPAMGFGPDLVRGQRGWSAQLRLAGGVF